MDNVFNRIVGWFFEPTSVSVLQENGEGTISNGGFVIGVAVLVAVALMVFAPSIRKRFF